MKKLFKGPVFIFSCIGIIVLFFFLFPDYHVVPFPYNFGGLIISFIGFTIMGKARDMFKQHETSLGYEEPSKLVMEGPFKKSRNPMYLGMVLLLLGLAICFRNLFSLIIPLLFFLYLHLLVIPKEEKLMKNTFGKEYLVYKQKVRRWI